MTEKRAWQPTTPKVVGYLVKHPDVITTVSEIVEGTSLTENQVKSSLYNIRTGKVSDEARAHLELVTQGTVIWRSRPSKPSGTKPLYEELAITKAGTVLVQSEDGTIYKLIEVD